MKNKIKEQVAESNSASDKTLLPDNVNSPEEYLEYLDAIGYWGYVEKLEKFKAQMINLLKDELKSAYEDGEQNQYDKIAIENGLGINSEEWFNLTYGNENI